LAVLIAKETQVSRGLAILRFEAPKGGAEETQKGGDQLYWRSYIIAAENWNQRSSYSSVRDPRERTREGGICCTGGDTSIAEKTGTTMV
jgi:hypothetical protein